MATSHAANCSASSLVIIPFGGGTTKVAQYAMSGGMWLGMIAMGGVMAVLGRFGVHGSLSLAPWLGLCGSLIGLTVTWVGRRVMGQTSIDPFA